MIRHQAQTAALQLRHAGVFLSSAQTDLSRI
jgi:hypothetical protein